MMTSTEMHVGSTASGEDVGFTEDGSSQSSTLGQLLKGGCLHLLRCPTGSGTSRANNGREAQVSRVGVTLKRFPEELGALRRRSVFVPFALAFVLATGTATYAISSNAPSNPQTSGFVTYTCAHSWYVDGTLASGSNTGTSWANAWRSFANIAWGSIAGGDCLYLSGGFDLEDVQRTAYGRILRHERYQPRSHPLRPGCRPQRRGDLQWRPLPERQELRHGRRRR